MVRTSLKTLEWIEAETYSERLEVIHGDLVAEKVKESILEHAAVAVAREGGKSVN